MQVSADSTEDGVARENNLYVKNLAPDVDDARLERMFNVRQFQVRTFAEFICSHVALQHWQHTGELLKTLSTVLYKQLAERRPMSASALHICLKTCANALLVLCATPALLRAAYGHPGRVLLIIWVLRAGTWQRVVMPGAVRPCQQEQAGRLCSDGDPPAGCAQCGGPAWHAGKAHSASVAALECWTRLASPGH